MIWETSWSDTRYGTLIGASGIWCLCSVILSAQRFSGCLKLSGEKVKSIEVLLSVYLLFMLWKRNKFQTDFIGRSVSSVQLLSRVQLFATQESQHTRPHCPSPTPRVHSDSHPSSQWCHPANSSSVILFFSCPLSLPASESFPMSQLFAWGGQGTGVSALASFLPKKSQGWSPSEWTGWISLQSKGPSRVFSKRRVKKLA